jgi:hypothetical protein
MIGYQRAAEIFHIPQALNRESGALSPAFW